MEPPRNSPVGSPSNKRKEPYTTTSSSDKKHKTTTPKNGGKRDVSSDCGIKIDKLFEIMKEARELKEETEKEDLDKDKKNVIDKWKQRISLERNGFHILDSQCGLTTERCSIEEISTKYLLYGCVVHGGIHQCETKASCSKAIVNQEKMLLCPISSFEFGPYIDCNIYGVAKRSNIESDESLSPQSYESDEDGQEEQDFMNEFHGGEFNFSGSMMDRIHMSVSNDSFLSHTPTSNKKIRRSKSVNSDNRTTDIISINGSEVSTFRSLPASPLYHQEKNLDSYPTTSHSTPVSGYSTPNSTNEDRSPLVIHGITLGSTNSPYIRDDPDISNQKKIVNTGALISECKKVLNDIFYNNRERTIIDKIKLEQTRQAAFKEYDAYIKDCVHKRILPCVVIEDYIINKHHMKNKRISIVKHNTVLLEYYSNITVSIFNSIKNTEHYKKFYDNQSRKQRTTQQIQRLLLGILYSSFDGYIITTEMVKHSKSYSYQIEILPKDSYISDNMYDQSDLSYVGRVNIVTGELSSKKSSIKYGVKAITNGENMLKNCISSMSFNEIKGMVKDIKVIKDRYKYENEINEYLQSKRAIVSAL